MELKEIYQPISKELSQVESELKEQVNLFGKNQKFVGEIINQFFNAPGKRLRPALVLLSTKAISPDHAPSVQRRQSPDRLLILATAVELIHSASLIHDDVVDIAFSRRKQPTLNKQFGNKIAVLAGDMLYAHTFSLLTDNFDKKILRILSKCVEKMCRGEINACKKSTPSFEEYLKMIEDKTASFMSACCDCGAILNNTDKKLSQALADYGLNIGMAYQIIDDYIDKDSVNIKGFNLVKAEEFASKARRSITCLKNSIYKEKLFDLVEYTLNRAQIKEAVECS